MITTLDIQLITLEETPERQKKALKELSNLPNSVVTHKFKKASIGWKGCISSHMSVYEYGKKMGKEMLWICEDNIYFANKIPEYIDKFLSTKDWGIIFVGGYIHKPWGYCKKTSCPGVYETRNTNHGTVSYIIHSRLYNQILLDYSSDDISIPFDHFLNKYTTYILSPLIFYHAHDITSNINQIDDVWRFVWYHPRMMRIHSAIFFNRSKFYVLLILLIVGLWYLRARYRA